MLNDKKAQSKNLAKEAPRSPHLKIDGFVILARAIDKCRAGIAGTLGEYNFDCPLDKTLFDWKGINGEDFKKFVATGADDGEIAKWLKDNGKKKTDAEIKAWSDVAEAENYSDDPEGKEWLEEQNKRLNLPKDGTLFDYLDADDAATFPSVCNI